MKLFVIVLFIASALTACGDGANRTTTTDTTVVSDSTMLPVDSTKLMTDSSTSGDDTAQTHQKPPGR